MRHSTSCAPFEICRLSHLNGAIASAEKKLGHGGRLIVRPSGTEPVIRVMGEGDDKILVEAVADDVIEALSQVAA